MALARALFDKHLYEEVVEELIQVIRDVPDNLVAQRLLAESSLMLGRVADALGSYKMLLYFAPQDPEVPQRSCRNLKLRRTRKATLVLSSDPKPVKVFDPEPRQLGPQIEGEFGMAETGDPLDADPEMKRKRWSSRN